MHLLRKKIWILDILREFLIDRKLIQSHDDRARELKYMKLLNTYYIKIINDLSDEKNVG